MNLRLTVSCSSVQELVCQALTAQGIKVDFGGLYPDVQDGLFLGYSVELYEDQLIRLADKPEVEVKPKWQRLADGGTKIPAIKEYRFQTNSGLKEAKDVVDKYWLDHGIQPHYSLCY